jgi:hypothetical protein
MAVYQVTARKTVHGDIQLFKELFLRPPLMLSALIY